MLEKTHKSADSVGAKSNEDEFYILDALILLGQQKKILIGVPVITTAIALAAAVFMSPVFVSTTVILPPQQQSSGMAAAMLGQLGGLAGAAGSITGMKSPNDLYVGMLKSRTIGDVLIKKFDLKTHYDEKTMHETRKELSQNTAILNGKDGMITVSVEDEDPRKAADMANAYVDELALLTKKLALTEASKRRIFFEGQLKATKEDLAKAEIALEAVQKNTGMLQLDGQVKSIISSIAQLQSLIASREVQLSAMRTFATPNNPEMVKAQEELRSLKGQLAKLQTGGAGEKGNLMVPTNQIPEVGVEYIRRVRDVKYQEAMFEMLAKQFELAKVDEAKDSSLIQQLDVAEPAEKKVRPKKLLIVLGGLVGGGLLGILIAMMRSSYIRSKGMQAQRWSDVRTSWKT